MVPDIKTKYEKSPDLKALKLREVVGGWGGGYTREADMENAYNPLR